MTPPDDAAVYRLSDDLAVIGTVDFFPPLVDDPATYGAIAAANAVSDVFAMGGRVLFAMAVAALPEDLPREAMEAIFAGAAATVEEAGGVLAGGHTIRDGEPKYGLAVVGVAHPDRLLRKGGARPGDILLLTKRLGTGLLVSGRRGGRTAPDRPGGGDRPDARAQSELLRAPRRAWRPCGDRCHRLRPARPRTRDGRASGARLAFDAARLPALDGALELAHAGIETGGAAHNRRFVAPSLDVDAAVSSELVTLAHDPQTSGGLLAAIPPTGSTGVERAMADGGLEAWRIGIVEAGTGVALRA